MYRNTMIDGSTTSSSFQSSSSRQAIAMQVYGLADDNEGVVGGGSSSAGGLDGHSNSLLFNLSLLKEKVYQVQNLVNDVIHVHHPNNQNQPPNNHHQPNSMSMASISTLIQEIIVSASTMMFTCQQMMSIDDHNNKKPPQVVNNGIMVVNQVGEEVAPPERQGQPQVFFNGGAESSDHQWFGGHDYHSYNTTSNHSNFDAAAAAVLPSVNKKEAAADGGKDFATGDDDVINCDIIELDAADLLAKYTHYCQICGKGFKRDANLRMHMRAHGDEYKSSAALSNPLKNNSGNSSSLDDYGNNNPTSSSSSTTIVKYSCPQEGCKWNKKHAKFQPLKSMICVKNHFKRSHCPKMYVCKRCNQKQFSVLSDLRTHEKHCGDLKWQCSCGTTFSRKDKLMGHVALFVGHAPVAVDQTRTKPGGRFIQSTHQSDNNRC